MSLPVPDIEPPKPVVRLADGYIWLAELLGWVLLQVGIALAVLLVAVVSLQVVTRYVFGFVYIWGGELATYVMIFMTLMLVGPILMKDDHLRVDLLFHRIPAGYQRLLRIVQLFMILFLGSELTLWGYEYASTSGRLSQSFSMGFDMYWVYIVLPLTGVIILFFGGAKLVESILYPERLEAAEQGRYVSTEADD